MAQNKIKYIQFEYWDKPKEFYELLSKQYDMFLILEDEIIDFMPAPIETINNLTFTTKLNEYILNNLIKNVISRGYGGNIFCINKSF